MAQIAIVAVVAKARMMRMGRVLLMFAVLGGKSVGASFDCQKEGLSKIESTICAHGELSELDSQLGFRLRMLMTVKQLASPDAQGCGGPHGAPFEPS